MRALAIAATGMSAQQLHVEVVANNMANINTTGFKRARAEFSDLLYQAERLQGVSSQGRDNTIPEGAQIGLGVRTAAIRSQHEQGTLAATGNNLDLALTGRGWFQITGANGDTVYTRAGAFNTNANGQLVTLDGLIVVPAIIVPPNVSAVTVSASGLVSVTQDGQTAPQQIGQLTLANFANEAGLEPLGGNLARFWPYWPNSIEACRLSSNASTTASAPFPRRAVILPAVRAGAVASGSNPSVTLVSANDMAAGLLALASVPNRLLTRISVTVTGAISPISDGGPIAGTGCR